MIAYGEGLCLLLLRFMPGEYLRRSENLKLGELLRVNGDVYQTLVATPGWIKDPPTLPTRHYFPYNQSKLLSWAPFTPTVTYFVNPDAMRIEGAVFTFYTFDRSHRGRWTVLPRQTGERFEAWVTEWSQSALGEVPSAIRGVYVRQGKTVREIQLEVVVESGDFFKELSLPAGRRQYEPWPPFSSEVYRGRISSGENDYANRVRLIDALAFEGKFEEALRELKSFLSDIQADSELVGESLGGIDWHLGFALYEILQNPQAPENGALWTDFEPTEPYIGILGRALDFFARWHRAEYADLVEQYMRLYRERFGLKAEIMHAAQRRLIERVETETDRALQLEELMRRADTDQLKLQALIASVEAFLRDENYQGALGAIELAGDLISDPQIRSSYEDLKASWEERIQAGLAEREERWIQSLIRAKEDLLSQLNSRLLREKGLNRPGVVERLQVLIEQIQGELNSLKNEVGR